jgi:hypothetical protein
MADYGFEYESWRNKKGDLELTWLALKGIRHVKTSRQAARRSRDGDGSAENLQFEQNRQI